MIRAHLANLTAAIQQINTVVPKIETWGSRLASVFTHGGKLLVCGNGGSAAEAQHLTGELVGRFMRDRRPLPAVGLHSDTSSTSAIINDFGSDEVFARQVRAHGQPGDVLIALSTSGQSRNVCRAVNDANDLGLTTWSLTGRLSNDLATLSDDAIGVDAPNMATVQEVHLVVIHALCLSLEHTLEVSERDTA